MKKPLFITALSVVLAATSLSAEVNVSPKSKKVTDLKFSGRIQGQWDGIGSDNNSDEDKNHFYFRRLFLGGHAKIGDNWGGDIVMDFAASPNNEGDGKADQVFIEGASVWYKSDHGYRLDIGQKKVPFGLEEVTSSAKMKTIERSAVNRQFAETLKFNARHTGLFGSGKLADTGLSYDLAVVNSGQNHNSKDSALNDGLYGYDNNEFSYYGRLSYEGDINEISYLFGVAAGVQQNDDSNVTKGYDATNAWNIFARVGTGPFELEAEYMSGTADTAGGDHDHEGYSIQGAYIIEQENKGDWEFVYRYSIVEGKGGTDLVSAKEIIRRANLASASRLCDEFEQHYFGINYLFNGHDIKFMLGYEMNDIIDGGITEDEADGFRARMQFLF
jgi:phosphate-selective porin OprO/OprP